MNLLKNCYTSCVNLDHRKDRLQRMHDSLAKVPLVAVRQRGMMPEEYTGDRSKVQVMWNRTKGAVGCHFSQVAIMQEAMRRNQNAFVMEDDLVFCSDFHERIAIIDQFVSTHEWDVIWLGGTFHVNPPYWHKDRLGRDAELTDNPRMVRTYGAFCTYAYIVNVASLEKILRLLDENVHRSMGIDWLFIQLQPELKTFAFVPGLIKQYDNESDIGNPKHGSTQRPITKFSGFEKLGPYFWQDKMTDFDPATFNWAEAKV